MKCVKINCFVCGNSFVYGSFNKHILKCIYKNKAKLTSDISVIGNDSGIESCNSYLIKASSYGEFSSQKYVLYLSVPINATLNYFSDFLESVWLNCECEHLKRFIFGDTIYDIGPNYDSDSDDSFDDINSNILNNINICRDVLNEVLTEFIIDKNLIEQINSRYLEKISELNECADQTNNVYNNNIDDCNLCSDKYYDENKCWTNDIDEYENTDVILNNIIDIDNITSFAYEYDTDTATILDLDIITKFNCKYDKIIIMGQNQLFDLPCRICSSTATKICGVCSNIYCNLDVISEKHKCCEDMKNVQKHITEIYNSPRTGICGYNQTSDEIYLYHQLNN